MPFSLRTGSFSLKQVTENNRVDLYWKQLRYFWAHWHGFIFHLYSCPLIRNVCLSVFVFAVLDRSLVASCKDSIGWMFSKLDTNSDLYLDQAELAAINLDKYEVCIRPFFNSCDSYRDGKVSTAEWCLCFWRESEYPGQALWGLCSAVHTHSSRAACADVFPSAHALKLQGARPPSGVATSVLCAGLSLFVFLLILMPPVGKGSPQGAKNIPAARWQPVSPTALGDRGCQPTSQAETRSQSQAHTDLEEKTWESISKFADHQKTLNSLLTFDFVPRSAVCSIVYSFKK